eukprot:CAMPEP_0204190386 /NCGR_PEP_ID=MMETSP0361-20130328/59272_1 /ASSEMBLY_ACC=CAM_ASM_000343 /TAXON_ID=268821 /ORGANISM="Scrippsiella Hangoei, Strain SHTV-5" /LENGTH=86 /DNA_ID=CAMNT_0051151191 /DNA_START=82 /DNA_END=337 /DNA_ORIENTATION=+
MTALNSRHEEHWNSPNALENRRCRGEPGDPPRRSAPRASSIKMASWSKSESLLPSDSSLRSRFELAAPEQRLATSPRKTLAPNQLR